MASPIPKFDYVRSKKHLLAVSSLPCQNCGLDGQTQAAHSNWAEHGKGRGIKASDEFVAALCATCHYEIDQGKDLSAQERRDIWEFAYQNTKHALQRQGKWSI